MHSSRTIVRVPQVYRIQKIIPTARSFHHLPTPFLPRFINGNFGFPSPIQDYGFSALTQDFGPLMRLFDDLTVAPSASRTAANRSVVYQPRFDVREVDGFYEFRGELPGVEQQNVSVEFADAQTLVIRGRTVREISPQQEKAASPLERRSSDQEKVDTSTSLEATTKPDYSDAVSSISNSSYQKPTVEDAAEDGVDEAAPSSPGASTPTSSTAENIDTDEARSQAVSAPDVTPSQPQQQEPPNQSQYWVSERTVGEFQRTFTFPRKVDVDGVRATLKDGVLNITVPKAAKSVARRINIE